MKITENVFIENMTWTEAKEYLAKAEVILLPIGSIEQHGPHLPLDTDIRSVVEVCKETAHKLFPKVLIAPSIPYGDSRHWLNYEGTISLTGNTLTNVIYDICKSLYRHKVRRIILINGHGANENILWGASWKVKEQFNDLFICYLSYWNLISSRVSKENIETTMPGHADEFETSISLAKFPNRVRKDKINKRQDPKLIPDKYTYLGGVFFSHFYTKEIMGDSGFVGDPTLASKQKGEKLFKDAVNGFEDLIMYIINNY
jgi:creatinine amidohydrolase